MLARNYTKGLVLVYTAFHVGSSTFADSVKKVLLNGVCQSVASDMLCVFSVGVGYAVRRAPPHHSARVLHTPYTT